MYLGYLDYLDYLDLLDYLDKYYIGIHVLNNSNYITLVIGHTKHSGEQRVYSFPFAVKRLRASNRQDFVFIRPPGISHGAFQLQWIMSGSARCCFCLKLSLNQTLALRDMHVLLYL